MDSDAYCREVEAHLCRKNAGHLVRVVGPAFEMVARWAGQGIPLKVALSGIDRAVERRAAKGPGRRPLRVEFCEADVLDAFDEWRRAVGVAAAPPERRTKAGGSLRAHLDRVVTRLTDRTASGALAPGLEAVVDRIIGVLADEREASRTIRGDARLGLVSRLQALDDELLAAAAAATSPAVLDALRLEAEQELAGFRGRMPAPDHARAVDAATSRLLRDRLKLPEIGYQQ